MGFGITLYCVEQWELCRCAVGNDPGFRSYVGDEDEARAAHFIRSRVKSVGPKGCQSNRGQPTSQGI